eukprot:13027415-Alexandrium_andersonii.AAC.1
MCIRDSGISFGSSPLPAALDRGLGRAVDNVFGTLRGERPSADELPAAGDEGEGLPDGAGEDAPADEG